MDLFDLLGDPIIKEEIIGLLTYKDAIRLQIAFGPKNQLDFQMGVADGVGHIYTFKNANAIMARTYKLIMDTDAEQLLIKIVQNGILGILKILLELGVNPNSEDEKKDSVLTIAARNGHIDIFNTLIKYGANISGIHGIMAFIAACYNNRFHIARFLRENGVSGALLISHCNSNLISHVAGHGYTEITQLLLEEGIHVNTRDVLERTPLIWAAEGGHISTVKLLLHHDADVNIESNAHYTALLCAAENGHTEIVELLLEYGANVNVARLPLKKTPLIIAAQYGYTDIVRMLIAYGADINAVDYSGQSAMDYATQFKYITMLNLLKR